MSVVLGLAAAAAACSLTPMGAAGDGAPPRTDASMADVEPGSHRDAADDATHADVSAEAHIDASADAEEGGCAPGACEPTVVASGQTQPLSIAVDAQHVFWTNASPTDGTGSVMRADLDGADVVALASGRNHPFGIALDGTSVYWSEEGSMPASFTDGALYRLGKDGSCPKAPCPSPVLGGQVVPLGIAVDDTSIYFARAGDGTVWRWGKDGSAGAVLSSSEPGPVFVAASASGLFWTDEGTSAASFADGRVRETRFDGGVSSVASSQSLAYGLAVDSTSVYWVDLYGGTLNSAAQSGDGGAVIVSGLARPVALTVSGGWIYFAVQGPMGAANEGAILATRTDGTCPGSPCPVVLSSQRSPPGAIAADASFVYWTEPGAGHVMRVAH